ncbi:pur operon repressor [Weissella koreensis]|uniref:Pur operon repressor n=1 Tax=Weissella koreensis TaxID=165096 RepID=A0A7H1ML82_9LACO|nr:pur operon repressor [Weissella koreensis]AEJ23381.1 pur operon repressor [Weissella koreensis KACC 15510]AVH75014.1 pur operon repressor [Weissella koreensis]EJF33422.1 purine operon repressor [Weissella koreensis KCTC 3621]QGN20240.1 pur operon repressor [Weissella koreensis]QNT64218.1 pur operon repressor [Weissella koreensis]
MKIRRSDRLVDMTRYLLAHPRTLISLTKFADQYESAKSSISEDLAILKRTFLQNGTGILETIPGAAGGAKFTPIMTEAEAENFVDGLVNEISDETRVLPGGYVYLSDLLGQPWILEKIGRLIATQYIKEPIDAVITAATKGVPVAQSVAEALNVPFVIARNDTKVTEGPTMSVNYVTGQAKRLEKMELSRRSLPMGSRVLIVDDFMKAGGTIRGMESLVREFEGTVAGVAVVVEGEVEHRVIDKYSALIHVNTDKEGGLLDVRAGNFKTEIYQDNSQLQQLTKK